MIDVKLLNLIIPSEKQKCKTLPRHYVYTVMAAVFFKEKLTVKCVVGISTALAGLLVMNML